MQVDAFFRISKEVRYVALYLDGQLTLRERPGLTNASASESDKYEELIVNPGVLTLVRQRGNIDCGGVEFCNDPVWKLRQTVWPVKSGHVSLGLEPSANLLEHTKAIQPLIVELGL